MSIYRDILKHSAVYGVGHLLPRLASVLLLPLYTSYLSPADYGIIAILDLTVSILEMLAAGGISTAAIRFHFDAGDDDSRHAIWTTGLLMLGLISLPQILLAWLFSSHLATLTFGPEEAAGALYFRLSICSLAVNLFLVYSATYVRALKRSGLFALMSVSVLLVKVGLNIWMIAFLGMGVLGFLYSNLIAGSCQAVVYVAILFAGRRFSIVPGLLVKFWSYSWPFVVAGLASLVMHQADRYMLRWLTDDMAKVGILALAYNLVQGVNTLVTTPFFFIWGPTAFEVNQLPERKDVFERVFKYFLLGMFLVLAGVALLRRPIVMLLSKEEFHEAADLIPILCVAFLMFPLHAFFSLPATLHKRTVSIAKTALTAALVKVFGCWALISTVGLHGAALSSVLAYAAFSGLGYLRYRSIEKLRFPLRFIPFSMALGAAALLAVEAVLPPNAGIWVQIGVGSIAWLGCFIVIALGPARSLTRAGFAPRAWIHGTR